MIPLTLEHIAHLTGGQLHGEDAEVASGVVTDSRECTPGSLYVARVGEHADGHDYAPSAVEAGAVGVLGERPLDVAPTVVVDDVELAFAKIARAVVDGIPGLRVIAVTGSSGKTSTKDLLGAVLSRFGPTVAPYGSLNSEVGVPLTVCRLTAESKYLVAEMGASGVGHIEYLTRIAPPQVSIVLNVGKAHMGEFGSVEAIAQTKGELVEALDSDGVAVLNADDPLVRAMAPRSKGRVVLVGLSEDAAYRATDVRLDEEGRARYHLTSPAGEAEVALAVVGEHQVGNSLSVIAACAESGLPITEVVEALATAGPTSRWRMEVTKLDNGVTVINDAYNANPDSMRAAVRALAQMTRSGTSGQARRAVAVLGEMRELGESSRAEHAAVGRHAQELGIDRLVIVGDGAVAVADGARDAGMPESAIHLCPDVDAAFTYLRETLTGGDIALFKSSRDSGLRYLGDKLVAESGRSTVPATEVTP